MGNIISYDKIFIAAVFSLFVIGIFGTQEAMAGNGNGDIDINKCVAFTESEALSINRGCLINEASARSIITLEEGDTGFFKIEALRVSEASVSSVIVQDKLPEGLEFVDTIQNSGNSYNPSTGVWDVGTIDEGSTRSLIIEFKVSTGTCGSDLVNTASLTSADSDSNDSNDSDSATVQVDEDCPPPPPTACDMFAVIGRGSPTDGDIGPGTLVRVTPGVDGFTFVGPGVSSVDGVGLSGLAIDSNGRMFASTVGPNSGTASRLVELDPNTGEVIDLVGKIVTFSGKGVKVRDLSFQPGTNILYGIAAGNPTDRLGTINTDTGVGTLVGNLPSQAHWAGLAFGPDGTLYATGDQESGQTTGPFIIKLNPLDASFSRADGSSMELFMDGLGVNPCTGTVFGDTGAERNSGNTDTIYEINPNTGEIVKSADDIADPSDIAFFPLGEPQPVSTGGGDDHEPPTIGRASDGVRQVVENGMCIDAQCWTVTQPYHAEMELIQMLTSPHTISNTIFCNQGADKCNFVGIVFGDKTVRDYNNPVMGVEASKNLQGDWNLSVFDPNDHIADPGDAIPGNIVFSSQIINDKFLTTSFTIVFKNKDTVELAIGIQVRDTEGGVRTFWFNEGVEFIDAHAYPYIETAFEAPLEVEPLCIGEDVFHRGNCAFDKVKEWATNNAEETMRQMLNSEYTYK